MDKKKALQIIVQAADLYKTNLENRKILFLYGVPGEVRRQIESDMTTLSCIEYYEAAFRRANFLHLTGVHFNPAQVKSAAYFTTSALADVCPKRTLLCRLMERRIKNWIL